MSTTKLPLVIFSDKAVDVMRQETHGFGTSVEETGGMLVGRRLDSSRILVVAATQPGPSATHWPHMFAPDVDFANQELDRLRQKYPNADFIGIWHKHPPSLDHPSEGDAAQAAEMLADPDYSHLNELVAPIIVFRDGKFSFKTYYINRALIKARHFFQQVEHKIVTIEDAETLLTAPPPPKWYAVPEVQEYLVKETERLDARFTTQLKEADDEIIVIAQSKRNPQATVYFTLSEGFPQAPPTAILEHNGQEWAGPEPRSLSGWTTAGSLVRVADDFVDQLTISPPISLAPRPSRAPAPPSPKPGFLDRNMGLVALVGSAAVTLLIVLVIGMASLSWFRRGKSTPVVSVASPTVPVVADLTPTSAPQPTSQDVAMPTPIIQTPHTPTLPPAPTATPTAIPKPTDTPVPAKPQVIITGNLTVRSGPGIDYKPLYYILPGDVLTVIGRNTDDTWWQIQRREVPDSKGWISSGEYIQHHSGDLTLVPVVEAPALPPMAAPPPENFAGHWDFNFGTMELLQDGDSVTGKCTLYGGGEGGSVEGIVNGNTLDGTWFKSDGSEQGEIHWDLVLINEQGRTFAFTGHFIRDDGKSGQWCGAQKTIPFLNDCGFSGFWNLGFGQDLAGRTDQLEQKGPDVTGTYEGWRISGSMTGMWRLEGKWTAPDGTQRDFVWELDPDGQTFRGHFLDDGGACCGWRDGLAKPDPCGIQ